MMNKIDLYTQLGMEGSFWGGLFEYEIKGQQLETDNEIFDLLDRVCLAEHFTPLNGEWNKLGFEDCCRLLKNALTYDLAFTSSERMPKAKAEQFYEEILSRVNTQTCKCFTNWFQSPWDSDEGVSSNPITENTFDMAIIFIDSERLVFAYFISED